MLGEQGVDPQGCARGAHGVDVAADVHEFIAVAGDEVVAARDLQHPAGELPVDLVEHGLAVGLDDGAGVVDGEHAEGEWFAVAQGHGDVALEAVLEVAAAKQAGEAVAQGRLVEVVLEVVVAVLVEGEAQHARGPELDLVALAQGVLVDALAVGEGPIGRAGIGEVVDALVDGNGRVGAGDSLVVDAHGRGQAATDGRVVRVELDHLAHAVAREDDDEGTTRRCAGAVAERALGERRGNGIGAAGRDAWHVTPAVGSTQHR